MEGLLSEKLSQKDWVIEECGREASHQKQDLVSLPIEHDYLALFPRQLLVSHTYIPEELTGPRKKA